jgi:hypothetical protein
MSVPEIPNSSSQDNAELHDSFYAESPQITVRPLALCKPLDFSLNPDRLKDEIDKHNPSNSKK